MNEITPLFLLGSICLDDAKSFIRTGKNGKRYLNFVVKDKKAVDNWGNTHDIVMSMPKDEVERNGNVFIGSCKEYKRKSFPQNDESYQTQEKDNPSQTVKNIKKEKKEESNEPLGATDGDDLPF